jgi:hypothetical protein
MYPCYAPCDGNALGFLGSVEMKRVLHSQHDAPGSDLI